MISRHDLLYFLQALQSSAIRLRTSWRPVSVLTYRAERVAALLLIRLQYRSLYRPRTPSEFASDQTCRGALRRQRRDNSCPSTVASALILDHAAKLSSGPAGILSSFGKRADLILVAYQSSPMFPGAKNRSKMRTKRISISKQHVVQRMQRSPSPEIFPVYCVPKTINISIGQFSKRVTVSRPMKTRCNCRPDGT